MCEEAYCIQGASGLFVCKLVLVLDFSHILSSAGVAAIRQNLCGALADCCFSGNGVIWMSLQDKGKIP